MKRIILVCMALCCAAVLISCRKNAFSMGDNLKTAITQLALSFDQFDQDIVFNEYWEEVFVARFIQNTRASFDYLEMLSEKNHGEISVEEINYIQYSLTGIELDFSSFTDGLNRYDAASGLSDGTITGYEYEPVDNGVIVTADFEIVYDGTDCVRHRELTVELVENPCSCFDGYSVASISSKVIVDSWEELRGKTYVFYGTDTMYEEQCVFAFEYRYSEEALNYGHFVYADLAEAPALAAYVREHAGSDFKITYILEGEETEVIERVKPIDITVIE